MIVYLARAIQAFVMYCVNGTSGSSLLIESIDSMIYITNKNIFEKKKKCHVRMMIDRDLAEKKYENKVGMSSY